jgi:metal transporter CNNM
LGHVLAIVVSVTAVLFFGEILPHSLFLKYRFQIGAKMVPVIMLLMLLCWPLAKPLSFILDKFIGSANHLNEDYNRHQLRAMVNYQGRPSVLSDRPFSDRMGGKEVAIIASTLQMKNLRVHPHTPFPPATPLALRLLHTKRRIVPLTHSSTNRHRTS